MPYDKIDQLYDALKADGAVSKDRKNFRNVMLAPGKDGYQNRKRLFDALKADGAVDSNSYEEFAQRLGLHAVKPAGQKAPHSGTPMTAAEREEFAQGAQGIMQQAQGAEHRARNAADYAKGNTGLHVKPVAIGRNKKVVERTAFNPTTGKMGKTYLTETGAEHENRGTADLEQNAVDDYEERVLHPVESELSDAYAERDRLAKMASERGETLDNAMPAVAFGAGQAMTSGSIHRMSDEEYRQWQAATAANNERIKTLEAQRDKDKAGFWRGFADSTTDPNTWLFGIPGLADTATLYATAQKVKKGQPLTESEKAMLDNTIANQQAHGKYDGERGFLYRAGQISAQALPFVAEFLATGGYSGIANVGANFGSKAAAKYGTNAASKWLLKNTGVLAGDVAAGWAMANTTGAAKTATDVLNRKMGQVSVDKNENYKFEGDKGLGQSLWEGEAAQTLEYYTERLGEHLQIGNWLAKGAEKLGLSKLSKAINYMSTNKWLEKGGVQDYPSEVFEEEANIVLNAMLVGDNSISDLWDRKTQADIWGGMALSVGMMNVPKYAGTGYQTAQYYRYKHATDKAAKIASYQMDSEKWKSLQADIDGATNDNMADIVSGIMSDTELQPEEKKAAADYAYNLLKMRGYNMGLMNAAKDEAESGEPADHSADESFNQGYNSEGAALTDAKTAYELQQQKIAEKYGEDAAAYADDNPVGYLHQLQQQGADEEVQGDFLAYINAKSAFDGVIQRAQDDLDDRITESDAMIDSRMHRQDGAIHPATMKYKDRKVYVVSGNVVMSDDGTMVDNTQSDDTLIIRDAETGELEFSDPASILSVDETIDPEEEKAAAAEAITQTFGKERADQIDGVLPMLQGDTYNIVDDEGKPHTVQVVQNNGDGSLAVMPDGAQEAVPMTAEQLQAWADNANVQRVQQQEEEAMAALQPATTETETGNGRPTYSINDEITLRGEDGLPVRGSVGAEENADGLIEVYTESPIKGKKVNMFTRDELDGMLLQHNGEDVNAGMGVAGDAGAVERPQEDAQESAPANAGKSALQDGTTAEPMPMIGEGEDAEPDFSRVDPTRAHTYIYNEAGLDREEGNEFVAANLKEAQKALDKAKKGEPKMGTSIAKYRKEQAAYGQIVGEAQKVVDYWNGVKAEQDKIVAEESRVRAEQQAEETRKAVEAERQRKEAEAQKAAEQAEVGTHNVAPAIKEKWDAARKIGGAANEIVLPNGEKVAGRYVLVESGAASPSHNATNEFTKTEGFPIDENGQSVNDRDYERDKDAQRITRDIASDYDSRAMQSPVVVSRDGVVLSGNGRTMAGELAAANNTDVAYIEHLQKYPQQYGFTPEQVQGMEHPRVLFVPDADMPYTAETFAKYNQQEMKGQSKTEHAVKLGKVVDDATFNRIIRLMNQYDTLGDFYADSKATHDAIGELQTAGVVAPAQVAEMFDGDGISAQGREMLENMLIGKAFESNPDAVRQITAFKSMRQSVITALAEISNNKALGDGYSLEKELADAIALVYNARNDKYKAGERVSEYARQGNLFQLDDGATVADFTNATTMMLADVLNDNRSTQLKKILAVYNHNAADSAAGQMDMFSGGVLTKRDILNEVKQLINYGTEQQQTEAIGQAVERRKAESIQQDGDTRGSGKKEPAYRLSDEVDENGRQFVLTSEGKLEFGELGAETGLPPAPIMLSEGIITNPKTNDGYGLVHIEARHGEQIRNAGYSSVLDFIEEVAKHYEVIKEGKNRNGNQTYMLQLTDKHNNTLMVEMSADGNYWNINTAGIFKTSYGKNRKEVYNRHTTAKQPAGTVGVSQDSEQDGTQKSSSMNTPSTSSASKDSKSSEIKQKYEDIFAKAERIARESEVKRKITEAEKETDVNPTEAQKEAGNYKKGHVTVDGLDVTIEQPKGSVRRGKDADGKEWKSEMHNTYGYIKGTEGVDGDHIDIFLSDNPASGHVFVVDQVNPKTGEFDEHKVMYGFDSAEEAKQAYLSNYEKGWKGLGDITEVTKEKFKKWVDSSKRKTKPFAEYRNVKGTSDVNEAATASQRTERTGGKQAEQKSPSGNRLVTDERAEEIRKRLRAKLLGQVNMGIDPEILALGTELAVYHIEKGARKFVDYAKAMIEYMGEEVRPYLKAFYNGARDLPEMEELANEMSSYDDVHAFNVAVIGKEGEEVKPTVFDTAEQISKETTVERNAQEDAKNTIKTADVDNDVYSITKQYNSKRDVDIWVVRGKERTDKDIYTQRKQIAKEHGGYYSSFRGVNGFVFNTPEGAQNFANEAFNIKANENYAQKTKEIMHGDSESRTAAPRKIDVTGLLGELNAKGEAKLSDHEEPIMVENKTNIEEKAKENRQRNSAEKKKNVSSQVENDLFGGLFNENESKSQDNENNHRNQIENRKSDNGVLQGKSVVDRAADLQGLDGDIQESRNERHRDRELSEATGQGGLVRAERSVGRLQGLEPPKNIRNNHTERGVDHTPKGLDARIDANIRAIELMQQLMESGERATPEQMSILCQFSGWGGLGKAFNENSRDWKVTETAKKLRGLLGNEAYEQANMSRNSAYYTPAHIIDTLWDVTRALGFKGGRILEGSAGIGNIIGLMPADMSERSDIHAIEVDQTTGNILSLLYPDAHVDVQGFEQTKIPNGSIDLAITNVPFVTGLRVMDITGDNDLSKKFHDIHDFCIAKNIRKLRDGGIGVFITSNGTLDNSVKLREWITGDGNTDVIGAFRLNNETFGGTGTTSDIIVVRKRVNGSKGPRAIDVSTSTGERTADYDTGETRKIKGQEVPVVKHLSMTYNKYFMEHPENMGGEMHFGFEKGNTFRPTSKALYPAQGINQNERLAAWAKSFAKMKEDVAIGTISQANRSIYETLGENIKEGSMLLDSKGKLCMAQFGKAIPLAVNGNKVKGHTKEECFADYSNIKQAVADVLSYEMEHEDDADLQLQLDRLNGAYDHFINAYGHLHRNPSISFLRNDVDYPNILALETFSESGDKHGNRVQNYGKAEIFKKRVVEKEKQPEPKTIKDGIIASLYQFGRVDTLYISGKLNMSEDNVKKSIVSEGLGFENPDSKQMEVSYEYLSGNVREKLQQAQANNEHGEYDANIKALEKVIPMNIPAHLIDFTLGSSWIAPKLYEDYIKEHTDIDVTLINAGGTWFMKTPSWVNEEKNRAMGIKSEVLHKTIMGTSLIEAAIQNKTITVSETRKRWNGETETITDKDATAACASKIDEIRQDFKEWARGRMQADEDMSQKMERIYNDMFNNYVPKTIPDEFVPEYFGGANHRIKLRPHQGKAVVRGTTQPLLLAHEVGTGKTFTLISTAMEMRRLGTAHKPMIVVQNATVGQFVASAKELYPGAKVLTLEDKDHTADGRRNFYAKIKYNDWDMIVVPQSVFERIPDSEERQMAFIQDKIEEKMLVLEQMKDVDPDETNVVTRQAQKEIDKMQEQLAALTDAISDKRKDKDEKKAAISRQNAEVKAREMLDRATDDVETFDDMGIDAILVDEAHEYKHLGFATAMQRGVKGVDPSFSKKAQGVYLKAQTVLEKNNGRNVIFATGTPISNTAAEIWTFMRYLMSVDTMKDYGIYYFDDFVRNFGNLQQMLEFTTSGKFKENNRFAGYVNLPELVRIWSGVADTVRTDDQKVLKDKIPEMEGGKAQDIYLPQTKALRSVMKYVKQQLSEYENMSGKEKKENSHIPLTMYGIAKAAAVDARLVVSDAKDDAHSKTNEAVRQTLRSLEETKEYKGTVALFADNYQNKKSGFNLYEDIKKKLVAQGIPVDEIVIMKSGMSVKKKLAIFDKVNNGEVRVIMGSTFTLGTGVNIQERLHTLIHIDAPNRPMDYTQRNGRILRQGNLHKDMNKPVRVLRFGVEDSLDVTAYQRLKTKGAIADSIMNGQQMMANSMENRVLEEDEDVFGDTVAQLSGSEYAMLKNQAEKDVRKYEAKKKQWEADQTYVHYQIPRLEGLIREERKRLEDNRKYLDVIASTFGKTSVLDITIGKQRFTGVEGMSDFIKDYNKQIKGVEDELRNSMMNNKQIRKLSISFGDIPFEVKTTITSEVQENNGTLYSGTRRAMTYSCPILGIDDAPVKQSLLRNALEDIAENVITGNDFREQLEATENALDRDRKALAQVKERDGKPFEFTNELEKSKERLEEYSELMKQEMEEKEKKYAEIDADVNVANDITVAEEDEDIVDDENRYREVGDMGDGVLELATVSDTYTAKQREEYDLRQRRRIQDAARETASKLGIGDRVTMMETADGLTGRRAKAKGWFDTETGKIVVVLGNHRNREDVMQTILHEGVAHYGLRQLFGPHFDTFLDNILLNADEDVRRAIVEMAAKHGWDFRTATEEYLAGLAEDTDFERAMNRGWFNRIKDLFLKMLHKIGFEGFTGVELSDNELRYILWCSYENLTEPGRYRSILGEAADVDMQSRLKVGNYQVKQTGDGDLAAEPAPIGNGAFGPIYDQFRGKAKEAISFLTRKKAGEAVGALHHKDIGDIDLVWGNGKAGLAHILSKHPNVLDGIQDFINEMEVVQSSENRIVIESDSHRAVISKMLGQEKTPQWLLTAYAKKNATGGSSDIDPEPNQGKQNGTAPLQGNSSSANIGNVLESSKEPDEKVLFRSGEERDRAMARDEYNRMLNETSHKFTEAWTDSMVSLKKLQDAIAKASEGKIEDWENAYMAENAMSSTSQAEINAYKTTFFKDLVDAVNKLAGESSYEDVVKYVMAKHGLERNEKMAARDFNAYIKEHPEGTKTIDYFRNRDYSGLTALTETDNVVDAEMVAEQMVKGFEGSHNVTELWQAINAATKATLTKSYESGMIKKPEYEHIRDMFDYYVPLRGFDETTGDEVYNYFGGGHGIFNAPVKAAKGRRSLADDPFATIGNMAESAIMQGNRNKMKQKFLNLVLNHPSDAVSVNELYLKYDAVNKEWIPVFADNILPDDDADTVERKISDFNERMEQLVEHDAGNYKRGRDAVDIPYRVLGRQLNEHQVHVKKNGRDYVLTINGNPEAAQALNGQTNPDSTQNPFYKAFKATKNFMAAMFTQKNPAFLLGNLSRDAFYANSMIWVKEGANYALTYNKNWGQALIHLGKLIYKQKNGTLDRNNPIDELFYQFIMHGGETGYTFMNSVEDYKDTIAKMVKESRRSGWNPKTWIKFLDNQIDYLGRWAEDTSRFAAYMTSREMGRSVERSVWDAKEITVNFNKKGAGAKAAGRWEKGNRLNVLQAWTAQSANELYIFWNAGVQGLSNIARAGKAHPGKLTAMAMTYFTAGTLLPMLQSAIASAMGGDDDEYYNLPEWVRRSNLCIYTPNGWVTIPLPIELRAFYGLGELLQGQMSDATNYHSDELTAKALEQVSQLLPIDFMEGGGGMMAFVPSYAKPFVENAANKDWTGVPIYKKSDYNKNMPEWTKAYKGTSPELVALARRLNEISGGDKYTKGKIDVNPAEIEHLFEGYLGGLGSFVNQTKKTMMMPFDPNLREMRNVPIANKFFKAADERTKDRRVTEEYFRYVDEYEKTAQKVSGYTREARKGIVEYAEKIDFLFNSPEYERYQILKSYKSSIDKIGQALKDAPDDETRTELEDAISEIRKEAVDVLRATEQ
jgi:N12 class adenine-specific DNA methylase